MKAPHAEYPFKQWALPVLLKVKDSEILTYLLKQPSFMMTSQDFNSFVVYAQNENWLQGLKAFLSSRSVHFLFQSLLQYGEQKLFIQRALTSIMGIQDSKLKRVYHTAIVEEILTKRPYTKLLALMLL